VVDHHVVGGGGKIIGQQVDAKVDAHFIAGGVVNGEHQIVVEKTGLDGRWQCCHQAGRHKDQEQKKRFVFLDFSRFH